MTSIPSILITGCSSGFGLESARLFLERGWRVVAAMRSPRDDLLPRSDRLLVLPLDVTDPTSIAHCVKEAGRIDALVNNAGIGLLAPLEGLSLQEMRTVFDTNTIGTIAMTQAVLPQMRERRSGVVVNVTSSVTLTPLPLLSVYTASKAAINAFSESVALELAAFDIRMRLVLPGRSPATRFGENARPRMQAAAHEAYAGFAAKVFARMQESSAQVTHVDDVTQAVWRAVTDLAAPMRIPAGADALALASS